MSNYKSFFMVGIGGISMSSLALLLQSYGKEVFGSDILESNIIKKLEQKGIEICFSFDKDQIEKCDIVCYSGAIKPDDRYMVYARSIGKKCIERAVLLAMVAREYKCVIAIAGTHGKTTTTAMITNAFLSAGKKPTVHIGGEYKKIGGNLLVGEKECFITEACEYRDSFLALSPNLSVITNIEPEHLDYFGSFDREKQSFVKFCSQTTKKCFVNSDCKEVMCGSKCNYFGEEGFCSKNERLESDGKYSFDVCCDESYLGRCKLGVYGRHNIKNALACIAICRECGIGESIIFDSLEKYENVDRRLEFIGEKFGAKLFSDYAHHPTEITAVLDACKESFPNKNIVCIFQPHTFSRTRDLMKDFCHCFVHAQKLYLLDNYCAREQYDYYGSAEYLSKNIEQYQNAKTTKMTQCSKRVCYIKNKKALFSRLKNYLKKDSILLFLGAGDIDQIAREFARD